MTAIPVKALLFDLGGVLINIDFARALRAWSAFSPLSVAQLKAAFQQDDAYERIETGRITTARYFEHLRACLKLDATDEQIADAWNALLLDEITETVDAIRRAREQLKLPCYIFSNTSPTHHALWRVRHARMLEAFERVFVSSEIGLRKPHREAFDFVAREIGVPPQAILFFDDLADNVAGAAAAGFSTVHVRGPADVQKVLHQLASDF